MAVEAVDDPVVIEFDPAGTGFDEATAEEAGMKRDEFGHLGSLDPRSGKLLKGTGHETFFKAFDAEQQLGSAFVEREGRIFSVPKGELGLTDIDISEKLRPIAEEGRIAFEERAAQKLDAEPTDDLTDLPSATKEEKKPEDEESNISRIVNTNIYKSLSALGKAEARPLLFNQLLEDNPDFKSDFYSMDLESQKLQVNNFNKSLDLKFGDRTRHNTGLKDKSDRFIGKEGVLTSVNGKILETPLVGDPETGRVTLVQDRFRPVLPIKEERAIEVLRVDALNPVALAQLTNNDILVRMNAAKYYGGKGYMNEGISALYWREGRRRAQAGDTGAQDVLEFTQAVFNNSLVSWPGKAFTKVQDWLAIPVNAAAKGLGFDAFLDEDFTNTVFSSGDEFNMTFDPDLSFGATVGAEVSAAAAQAFVAIVAPQALAAQGLRGGGLLTGIILSEGLLGVQLAGITGSLINELALKGKFKATSNEVKILAGIENAVLGLVGGLFDIQHFSRKPQVFKATGRFAEDADRFIDELLDSTALEGEELLTHINKASPVQYKSIDAFKKAIIGEQLTEETKVIIKSRIKEGQIRGEIPRAGKKTEPPTPEAALKTPLEKAVEEAPEKIAKLDAAEAKFADAQKLLDKANIAEDAERKAFLAKKLGITVDELAEIEARKGTRLEAEAKQIERETRKAEVDAQRKVEADAERLLATGGARPRAVVGEEQAAKGVAEGVDVEGVVTSVDIALTSGRKSILIKQINDSPDFLNKQKAELTELVERGHTLQTVKRKADRFAIQNARIARQGKSIQAAEQAAKIADPDFIELGGLTAKQLEKVARSVGVPGTVLKQPGNRTKEALKDLIFNQDQQGGAANALIHKSGEAVEKVSKVAKENGTSLLDEMIDSGLNDLQDLFERFGTKQLLGGANLAASEVVSKLMNGVSAVVLATGRSVYRVIDELLAKTNFGEKFSAMRRTIAEGASALIKATMDKTGFGSDLSRRSVSFIKAGLYDLFTAGKGLHQNVLKLLNQQKLFEAGKNKEIELLQKRMNVTMQEDAIELSKTLGISTPEARKQVEEAMVDVMRGGDGSDILSEASIDVGRGANKFIEEMSQQIIDMGLVSESVATSIGSNLGNYLRRSYKAFSDPRWADKITGTKIYNDAIAFVQKNWRTQDPSERAIRDELERRMRDKSPGFVQNADGTSIGELKTFTKKEVDDMRQEIIEEQRRFIDVSKEEATQIVDDLIDRNNTMDFIKSGRIGSRDASSLMRKQDIPEEIRKVMGEVTDSPIEMLGDTGSRQAKTIAADLYNQKIREFGLENGLFSTTRNRVSGFTEQLTPASTKTQPMLDGLFTTPEFSKAWSAYAKEMGGEMGMLTRFSRELAALWKLAVVPGNIINNFVNNTLGATFPNLMMGHYGTLNPMNIYRQLSDILSDVAKNPAEYQKLMGQATRYGVVDNNVLVKNLGNTLEGTVTQKAFQKIFQAIKDSNLSELAEIFGEGFEQQIRKFPEVVQQYLRNAKDLTKKLPGLPLKLFLAGDDANKFLAWRQEVDALRKVFPDQNNLDAIRKYNNSLGGTTYDDLIAESAARNVNKVHFQYDQLPQVFRKLSETLPINPFINFFMATYRSAINAPRLAASDLAHAGKANNQELTKLAMRRFAGTAGVLAGSAAAAPIIQEEIFGLTQAEAEKIKLREPKFMRGRNTVVNLDEKTGNYRIINLGYMLPMSVATDPIVELVIGALQGRELGESVAAAVEAVTEEVLSPSGIQVRVKEAFQGESFGVKLYNPDDGNIEMFAKGAMHVAMAIPDDLGIRKFYGQVMSAVNGQEYRGRVREWKDIAQSVVGIRTYPRETEKQIRSRVWELSRDIIEWKQSSRSKERSLRRGTLPGGQEAFDAFQERTREALVKDYQHMYDLAIGAPEGDKITEMVLKSMEEAKLPIEMRTNIMLHRRDYIPPLSSSKGSLIKDLAEDLFHAPVQERREMIAEFTKETGYVVENEDYEKIAKEFKTLKKGMNAGDRVMLRNGVTNGDRARAIYDMLDRMPSERRNTFLKDYQRKGILTQKVTDQLGYIIRKRPL